MDNNARSQRLAASLRCRSRPAPSKGMPIGGPDDLFPRDPTALHKLKPPKSVQSSSFVSVSTTANIAQDG